MNRWLRIVLYVIFLGALAVCLLLPSDKYSWMQEMDPSINPDSIRDSSGNLQLFSYVILIVMLSAQWGVFLVASDRRSKIISVLVGGLALVVWMVKFANIY